jgi:NADH-quinone oxidoreductase subunit K
MTPTLLNYLIVGSVLFSLGTVGFLTRRNLILMMLSAELMLHGVSLNLVAFSRHYGHFEGQAFTVFVLTVAACEAGISLALILTLYRRRKTLDVHVWHSLGESTPTLDELRGSPSMELPAEPEPELPKLVPSGRVPKLDSEERVTHV